MTDKNFERITSADVTNADLSQIVAPPPDRDVPDCAKCGDSGWVEIPNSPNRAVRKCECRIVAGALKRLERAKIPEMYGACSFQNFKHVSDAMRNASAMVAMWASRYKHGEGRGLLLTGNCGTGKTHLACAAILQLMNEKRVNCLFADYRELLHEIRHSYNKESDETESSVLAPVFEANVLVLDELGAVKQTDWVFETVSLILNHRYNNRRATIITTNYPNKAEAESFQAGRAESLGDRVGMRMFSRLQQMCRVIEMYGDDYRMKK